MLCKVLIKIKKNPKKRINKTEKNYIFTIASSKQYTMSQKWYGANL